MLSIADGGRSISSSQEQSYCIFQQSRIENPQRQKVNKCAQTYTDEQGAETGLVSEGDFCNDQASSHDGGGNGVALEGVERLAVEGEGDFPGAVDAASAFRQTIGFAGHSLSLK